MTPTTDPDYGTVQATLCANLMRRGVVDQIIPREELAEWAQVLSDIACKPLAARVLELEAENKRLREGLTQAIDALDGKIPDLHERMCCNGHECGCQGSTNLCLLIHDLRTALKGGE